MFSFKFIAYLFVIHLALGQNYRVLDFGAKGDGTTDDTKAVRAALVAANKTNGGRVVFDSGSTFLTGAFNVTSNVILDIRGKILASTNNANYAWTSSAWQPLIYAVNVQNITITGGGVIDGQGSIWWKCAKDTSLAPCSNKQRPMLFNPNQVTGIVINNVAFKDSPMFNIGLSGVKNVHIYNISITAPASGDPVNPSHNTDGIDAGNSQNVLVENSYISVGDVTVMASSSYRLAENITFRNLTIGNGHGLAIGSYTLGGVRNVTFQDIVINGGDRLDTGPNIISQPGRGGLVQNITYSNIQMYNVSYCISMSMNFSHTANNATNNIPAYQGIEINNIVCKNSGNGWTIEGLSNSVIQAHITKVVFSNVKNPFPVCKYITGACNNATVVPYCPPCMK